MQVHEGQTGQDHPRMRGEKKVIQNHCFSLLGSPPHARGKDLYMTSGACHSGITPACAGKSNLDTLVDLRGGDHPRMRGEK